MENVIVQFLHNHDSQIHENLLRRWDLLTPESYSYGINSMMYWEIGEYISIQSENAEYGDAFVQKLADFFSENYPELNDRVGVPT